MANKRFTLKSHPVIWFLAVIVAAFGVGWSAHIAVQSAANLVAVPAEKAKLIDSYDAVVKERDQLREQQARIYEVGDQRARILALEAEREQLKQQLLKNRPTGPAYVKNISIYPKSPAVLKVGDKITVDFDYVIPKDQQAAIFVHPSGAAIDAEHDRTPGYTYDVDALLPLTGSGKTQRYFIVNNRAKVTQVRITMESGKEELYKIEIPVSYEIQ